MTFALVASLCAFSSCSKDDDGPDEPKGGKVSGNCKVDGKKFDLKYGYLIEIDGERDVMFFDKDVSDYLVDPENDAPNFDLCSVDITFRGSGSKAYATYVEFGYKVNYWKETGTGYEIFNHSNAGDYISISVNGNKVSCKSTSAIPVFKYDYYTEETEGEAEATFNISGTVTDFNAESRSSEISDDVVITVVTDPKQIERLKALKPIKR